MGLTSLQREDEVFIAGRELRAGGGPAAVNGAAIEEAIDPVLLEVFIQPDVVLLGVVVGAGVEVAVINDRGAAGNVIGGGCAAGAGEELRGGALDAGEGKAGRFVLVEQLHLRAVGLGRVGKGDKGGIFKGGVGGAVRLEGEVGLIAGEEEELMVRDNRTADAEGEIVGVVRGNAGALGRTVLPARSKPLVGVVLAGKAVDAIAAGLGGDDGLNGAGAAVVDGVGVGLDRGLLYRVGVGSQVDDSGADAAGDVQAIDDVLVGVGSAAVRAGVHRVFRIEVGRRSRSQTGDAGCERDERKRVAGRERKLLEGGRIERQLVAAVGCIQQRRLFGDFDLRRHGSYRERDGHIAGLGCGQGECGLGRGKARRRTRNLVVSRSQAREAINAGGVGPGSLRDLVVNVGQRHGRGGYGAA